ncbi:Arginase/deacetylase [Hypoxylon sp. FL1284]|nr:Arginase/deacetylase [Hypoxylon sp. FL1284]
MAAPWGNQGQPWLHTAANGADEDRQLLDSLNNLSLSTPPSNSSTTPPTAAQSSRLSRLATSPNSNANYNSATSTTPSASPIARLPSRSPVNQTISNGLSSQSRSATPTLLRKASLTSLRSSSGTTPSRAPSRRASYNLLSSSAPKLPLNSYSQMDDFKERPVPTAASVAKDYMEKELGLLHTNSAQSRNAETMVVIHDSCYGHRFSRPKALKRDLVDIVERPERILACILGVSMAYVRLGSRHCDGKHPIHPDLDPLSLPSVPFSIRKTNRTLALNSETVTNVHGADWIEELTTMCNSVLSNLFLPSPKTEVSRLDMNRGPGAEKPAEFNEGDLYLNEESRKSFEAALGAVCEAVDEVCSSSPCKRAFVVVRPPGHHCSASRPSGFCWVNNVHVGIMHGIMNHGLTHAAIIDFDLHHGDGSQAIAMAHGARFHNRGAGLHKNAPAWQKTTIGYFSMHDINSYPCEDGDIDKIANASVCVSEKQSLSIWNVHLDNFGDDKEFWTLYQNKYSVLLGKAYRYLLSETERCRASGIEPKAAIFISAGFDASEFENHAMQRHAVKVPTEFYGRITQDVVRMASDPEISVEGRVISVLEGGYSDRALYSGVLSHLGGLADHHEFELPEEAISGGLTYEVATRFGKLGRRNTLTGEDKRKFSYDPRWWTSSELDLMDATMNDAPSQGPVKKVRAFTPGNYSSPTQASTAKAVDPTKVRRSFPGFSSSPQWSISRPPTPPPPDVPWNAAACELTKLLVPNDRPVRSYSFRELKEFGARAKRALQPEAEQSVTDGNGNPVPGAAPEPAPIRKSMRTRKLPRPSYQETEEPKTRRKTVAGHAVLATENARARGTQTQSGSGLGHQPTSNEEPSAILRPTTSQSVRPNPTLEAKKMRPAKKATHAKSQATTLPTTTEPPVSRTQESTQGTKSSDDGIEGLITDVKRIKINVLTKEMREARQKKEKAMAEARDPRTMKEENKGLEEATTTPPITAQGIQEEAPVPQPFITNPQPPPMAGLASTPAAAIPTISTPVDAVPQQYPPAPSAPSANVSPNRRGGHHFTSTSNIPFSPQSR